MSDSLHQLGTPDR